MRATVAATLTAGLATGLLLAGCSGEDTPAPGSSWTAPPVAAAPAPPAAAPRVIVPGRPGEDARVLPGAAPSSPGGTTPADVAFVSAMIPHHEQALVMAALAPTRAADPRVKAVADRIAGVQGAEIAMLRGWMNRYGGGAPPAGQAAHDMGGMGGMGGGMGTMRGMATQPQLDGLAAASGPAFDRMFLDLMIAHHEGAQDMARRQQVEGLDETARQIADDVLSSQGVDIARMRALYS